MDDYCITIVFYWWDSRESSHEFGKVNNDENIDNWFMGLSTISLITTSSRRSNWLLITVLEQVNQR